MNQILDFIGRASKRKKPYSVQQTLVRKGFWSACALRLNGNLVKTHHRT